MQVTVQSFTWPILLCCNADGEEDREGMAMLQQASRLMKQVLLKGSPRSMSDADTAMFVDSGDDDSSQPRSQRQACPQDVPTPTVSDEPSEVVRPSRGRPDQVGASPIVQMIPSEMQISKGSRPLVTPMPPPPVQPIVPTHLPSDMPRPIFSLFGSFRFGCCPRPAKKASSAEERGRPGILSSLTPFSGA